MAKKNHFDAEFLPSDYNVFRTDRNGQAGGGVLIAANKESFIGTKQVFFFKENTDLEIVCVECTLKRARILTICCYRPPNSSSGWLLSFREFVDSVGALYEKIIITGCFNFPNISWSENWVIPSGESERIFCNALSDHYLSQLINPSRKSSVLDLLITSIPDKITDIDLIDPQTFNLYSDHKCVFFDFTELESPVQKITKTIYDYNCANFNEMNRTF